MGSYLGQNFLRDTRVQNFIADKVKQLSDTYKTNTTIEIGPGKGAITKKICNISPHFFVVETDEKMIKILQDSENIALEKQQIIHQSIMDFSIPDFFKKQKLDTNKTLIVGNLPYYITSPILRMFFGEGKQEFAAGIFMVQAEVGQKIKQDAHKKSFLRRLVNYSYEVKYIKTVPARAFSPAPKVKSCLISLTPKDKSAIPDFDFEQFYIVLDLISGFKRKTLGRIEKLLSKKYKKEEITATVTIPKSLHKKRLEELNWDDMSAILLENPS